MTPKFFGQFLLERGILQRNQLMEAIKYQRSKTRKFGEIAINKGYLTPDQVEKINQEQRRTDLLFGEIAVKRNLLTEKQVKEIVLIQQNAHVYLGEAIIETGLLSRESLDRALAEFKVEQGQEEEGLLLPQEIENETFVRDCLDMTQKVFHRMVDVLIKFGRGERVSSIPNRAFVSDLRFKGDSENHYVLSVGREIALEIARKSYKSPGMEYEVETVRDAVSEFVNVVCGNVTARLLTQGIKADINVPETSERSERTALDAGAGAVCYSFPINSTLGEMALGVVLK